MMSSAVFCSLLSFDVLFTFTSILAVVSQIDHIPHLLASRYFSRVADSDSVVCQIVP